ncbi:MAG: acyl-CoA dehydrogenase family protein, partial [Salinisphaeraceae bacterium]|nr:acyl-CoA dehydrogenase family protein [Salinisphaeraceae bacterium]
MTFTTALLIAIAAFWVLAYTGAKLIIWTVAAAAYVIALYATGSIGSTAFGITAILLGAIAAVFNLVPLRRALLTRRIFVFFKNVLPDMTSTEREALEAGEVWWEAEMFRGKPEWSKLLDFQRTVLTDEEQSFLDNETETLCSMIDDWKIQHEDHDLPEEVWNYIRNKGFMAMLISKEWGGLGFSAYAQSCVVTKIATRSIATAV